MKLYRHYDSEGRLLYVGISYNPLVRLGEHNKHSSWVNDIASITIEKYDDAAKARKAELDAIDKENPIHNKFRPVRRKAAKIAPIEDAPDYKTSDILLTPGQYNQELAKHQDRCRRNLRSANLYRLAIDSGVSRTTLYRIRRGEVLPRAETIQAIDWAIQRGA